MPPASTSTSAALLNQALELHRAGRLDEAGAIYEQLLTGGPEWAQLVAGSAPQSIAVSATGIGSPEGSTPP